MKSGIPITSWIAYTLVFLCVSLDARCKLSAQETGSILDAVRQGVKSAATSSAPRLEFEFFELVEKQANATTADSSFHDGLANWLFDEVKLSDNDKLRLRTCVYIFEGTDDGSGPYEEMTVHRQELETGDGSALIVIVRVPGTLGSPLARVAAVVEVDKGPALVLYTATKSFQHGSGRWKVLASTTERSSP